MSRMFSGYEGGLKPCYRFLHDKAVIVQAWKKAHEYIRSHNWYSDTLELDLSCIELEELYLDIKRSFQDHELDKCRPMPMRLVWAPKAASGWVLSEAQCKAPKGFSLRPLAHLAIRDQTISMMFMMCLANIMETRQKQPKAFDNNWRENIAVNYGNRLYCDWHLEHDEEDDKRIEYRNRPGRFLWANSGTYDKYYEDYSNFIARPDSVLKSIKRNPNSRYYVVSLDLSKFYDRIDREVLLGKIRKECESAGESYDEDFFGALSCCCSWSWNHEDFPSIKKYQGKLSTNKKYDLLNGKCGIPQGLVTGGFFANIYLFALDDYFRHICESRDNSFVENGVSLRLHDYCRYVDDIRIVVSTSDPSVDNDSLKGVMISLFQRQLDVSAPGQILNKEKIKIDEYLGKMSADFTAQMMDEIAIRGSGPMDEVNAWEILKLNRELWPELKKKDEDLKFGEKTLVGQFSNVKDETLERYTANNWRRQYRILSTLLHADSEHKKSSFADIFDSPCSKESLDLMTDRFVQQIFRRWLDDPSKVRILRVAFDLRPEPGYLGSVLEVLLRMSQKKGPAKSCAYYILSELYRAAVVETGFAYDQSDDMYGQLLGYRDVLRKYLIRFSVRRLPWYLANQFALFMLMFDQGKKFNQAVTIRCDRIYEDCRKLLEKRRCASDPDKFSVSRMILAYLLSHDESVVETERQNVKRVLDDDLSVRSHQLQAFIPQEVLYGDGRISNGSAIEGLDGEVMKNSKWRLRDVVTKKNNLLNNEIALLRLMEGLLMFFKDRAITESHYYSLDSLSVTCTDWNSLTKSWVRGVRIDVSDSSDGQLSVDHYMFAPEPWEDESFRRLAQIGRIIRSVAMGGGEYSAMRKTSLILKGRDGSRVNRFWGVKSSWFKRRNGLYFDRVCLGGVQVAFSPWFTDLLSGLLCWPGAWCAEEFKDVDYGDVEKCVLERIELLEKYAGTASETFMVPVDVDLKLFKEKGDFKELNVAIVQNIFPDYNTLRKSKGVLTEAELKRVKRHISDLLQLTLKAFKTREAADQKGSINLVVFPELSIHETDVKVLERFADKMNCLIFAGLLYCNHPEKVDKFVNAGMWIIPQKKRKDDDGKTRRLHELLQGKLNLANNEISIDKLEGYRPVQWIIRGCCDGKAQWSMTASICYDSTDIKLAADLRDIVDCYVVSAYNQDVGTFDIMAEAMRYHMYNHTIIANCGEFGGSTIQAPYNRPYERIIAHSYGKKQAVVSFAKLRLGDFEKRPQFKEKESDPPKPVPKSPPAGYNKRSR